METSRQSIHRRIWPWIGLALVLLMGPARADEIELQDGRKLTGLVQSQDAERVVFRVVYPNGGTLDRTFPAQEVKAVKKMPLPELAKPATPKAPAAKAPAPQQASATPATPKQEASQAEEQEEDPDDAPPADLGSDKTDSATTQPASPAQNRAAIDALIDQAGKSPPTWWDSVKLNVPPTLDLTWPQRAPPPWNPNKNVNQYYISIINPNPDRHQEGCKLMHHLMAVNKGNADVQFRGMCMLGRIYGNYLHDYARGAFWYRRAAKASGLGANDVANLAFYYWMMGNRDMALSEISRSGQFSAQTIRVLGGMGEVSKALDLAKRLANSYPDDAWLAAGDVCRFNGQFKEAASWYQQVLTLKPADPNKPGRLKKAHERANASLEAVRLFEQIDLKNTPDGAYQSESVGYRGPVRIEVTVKAGRIENVKVLQTKEDWPLNAQVVVPARIIEKQSVKGIDTVSSATVTSEAVLNATGKALAGAVRK